MIMLICFLAVIILIMASMMKFKLSRRQKDRKLKKVVDEHMKQIKNYEYNTPKNEDMEDVSDFSVASENVICMTDSFKECVDNEISSSDSDFIESSQEDFETKIEMEGMESESISDLAHELKTCCLKHNISHAFINDMLEILRKHHNLPKDARTLLDTPVTIESKNFTDGQYAHFGIRHGLELLSDFLVNMDTIRLSFNIDGLPLFKSSSHHIWPILCLVNNISPSKPFVVGIFSGNGKPDNLSQYLFQFIQDVKDLFENPVIGGRTYKIFIDAFICDAPARSYLKCIKNHNGYFGCERCTQKGKWLGRMTFLELDAPKRKDEDFTNALLIDSSDEHIMSVSPLLDINVGLVSMFPLEYMHLVCLGVVRKLILMWCKGPLLNKDKRPIRLSSMAKQNINKNLVACSKYSPREFQRRPRALNEVERWKATEFRSFLLYTGPVVIKDILEPDNFNHFLCLHIAIRIMLCENLISDYLDYAEELLHSFVKNSVKLYGEEFAVYNIHSLIHLAEDVRKFGNLNKISAFPFESYLGRMKKLLRTPHKPLQQLCKRLLENKHQITSQENKKQYYSMVPVTASLHFSGPTLNCHGMQYKEIKGCNFSLKVESSDNCIMLQNDEIILAKNFISQENQHFVIGQEFLRKTSFYTTPCDSSILKIYHVSCLSPLKCWPINEFLCKGILLPYKDTNVFLPLLHCYDNFF